MPGQINADGTIEPLPSHHDEARSDRRFSRGE
jgi:hypothetical protein